MSKNEALGAVVGGIVGAVLTGVLLMIFVKVEDWLYLRSKASA